MAMLRQSKSLLARSSLLRPTVMTASRGVSVSAFVAEASSSINASVSVTGPAGRNLAAEQKERQELAHQAEIVSDAPHELTQRPVRIFKPAKTANSSGKAGTSFWRIDWDILQGSARWENPLMGWASSGDYMQGTSLKFRTKEDAIHFCEKQGWDFFVQEPKSARIPPKSYAANYNYSPGKLKVYHTK
ncbi:hypothetical protein K437DRAFT_226612 [Tilletiaria anomala UBC 951]|uniref:NADH dehydrogenase [ubiquinone] iron-sulfur protein 4, mitochondrial n=1 Tax=Tilletiaria anomala (strain ATCC 24038 / CBS 436.72 / UBC 951) TaxID=1037660 RepID=A0A066VS87_TILAU|nr:uncharacterized protein K437DRAFT_226612 [Tilletiaria anomala UBC 951]KDN41669.1 hypothetical protein K437DRAFT_226612 [Tilletiaria anomala UBC 951]